MESDSSETNLVIITKRDRFKQFCKIYWKILFIISASLLLLPIAFIGKKNAYKCFYIFLLTNTYWIADVMHPSITSLVPIALSTIMGCMDMDSINQVHIRNVLFDCLGVMMLIVAMEHSHIHQRIALKLLITFGCSHYRLSFLLFFGSMFLSMWISNSVACGIMMPLVKAVLTELERMGLLEIYQTIGKAKQISTRHDLNSPRPTDFTMFYFLGIAYSSSIGGMATLIGSETNQIFKIYAETIFPHGPKIEFPHFMLLNLPGVMLMETLVYMWLNFYFLGMFRVQSEIAVQISLSEEEARYIDTLLNTQYKRFGRTNFREMVVGLAVLLTIMLQVTANTAYLEHRSAIKISAPCIVTAILLSITPANLNFTRFFQRPSDTITNPLPTSPSKACLHWNIIQNHMNWTVLFVIGSSCTIFEALKDSGMTEEFEKFLLLFSNWPSPLLAMVVIISFKLSTEFASDPFVVYSLLPHVARLFHPDEFRNSRRNFMSGTFADAGRTTRQSFITIGSMSASCNVHPHYLMMAATLSSSLPFHLITGCPANAMVASYVHISPWRMMYAGLGPTIISVVTVWFTVTLWSKAIWTDINVYPKWADNPN